MNVTLLACTPDALDVLLFTKQTRLTMSAQGLEEIKAWPPERKAEELRYMRNTIQSSWEFVDYIFAIEGVTRAFTHQLVRHRIGTSFAQQTMRTMPMEGFRYLATGNLGDDDMPRIEFGTRKLLNGPVSELRMVDTLYGGDPEQEPAEMYRLGMDMINSVYGLMLEKGAKPQDARGILPTNILTNIIFKANLRTLHDMALKRLCVKSQGEFQDVFGAIVDCVTRAHPWAADFLKVQCAWNGTCLFPSVPVTDCHVKARVYNPVTGQSYGQDAGDQYASPATVDVLYQLHRSKRTEIQPVVQNHGWDGIK